MQSFCHDLDPSTDSEILDADFTQGKVKVSKHDVEERLGQTIAIRLAPKPIDGQGSVQRQGIEAAVERVWNSAGVEQPRRTGLLRYAHVECSGKLVFGAFAAEHDPAPLRHG